MRLKYTGRAATFVYGGKAYHPGDVVPIPAAEAARMAARTNLHTFETMAGADVLDEVTAPEPKADPKKS